MLGNATAAASGKAPVTATATPAAADGHAESDFAALQKAVQENAPLLTPQTVHADRDPAGVSANTPLPVSLTPAGTAQPSAAPVAAASIAVPVGAEGWDQALGQQVVWMVSQKNSTAEIHVNPPDLGPLSVTVAVNNNTASTTFVAAHAATRDAIADAMPRLKEMLAESGIALGQVTVSAESFSQGGSGAGQPHFAARDPGVGSAGATLPAAGLVSQVTSVRTAQGLVDTFA